MNIGILSSTNYNKYALTLIYALEKQGFKPSSVIYVKEPIHKSISRQIRLSGIRETLLKIFQHLGFNSKSYQMDYLGKYAQSVNIDIPDYGLSKVCKNKGIEIIMLPDINSEKAIDSVIARQMDILINAGRSLFRPGIIDAMKIGILNAHMGFLPDFRGMNVLEWSLFYNRTIGVTLHFIARGIDTGDILLFKEIPIESHDNIANLRAKSIAINVELIVEGIEKLHKGTIERKRQQPEDGKQYFAMHDRLKRIVELKLKR